MQRLEQHHLAALLDKPVDEVRRMLNLEERVDSLDALRSVGDRSMLEMVPDEGTLDPAIEVQESNLMVRLDGLLDELPEKQREVVSRRFGLRGHDTSTLEEVGKAVGLQRMKALEIENRLDETGAGRVTVINSRDVNTDDFRPFGPIFTHGAKHTTDHVRRKFRLVQPFTNTLNHSIFQRLLVQNIAVNKAAHCRIIVDDRLRLVANLFPDRIKLHNGAG